MTQIFPQTNNHKRRSASYLSAIPVLLLTAMLGACGNVLPHTEDTARTRWDYFDDALNDYNKIVPYETSVDQLKKLGYDPFSQPNIKVLSYLDIIARFMPKQSITLEDLDPGLSNCIRAQNKCLGYEAHPRRIKSKRVGNVFMDLFTFKRKTIKTGWTFDALIVIKNDTVVYKIWSGEPNVSGEKIRKNPLGPLQAINASTIRSVVN